MSSQKQMKANRRNARRSTGPKTPEGKARSRLNALKHGLLAQDLILSEEDPDLFIELLEALEAELQPSGLLEQMLLHEIASARWRLRRLLRVESGLFSDRLNEARAAESSGERATAQQKYHQTTRRLGQAFQRDICAADSFTTLTRYEATLQRAFYRAFDRFRALRRDSSGKPQPPPPEPVTQVLRNEPTSPAPPPPAPPEPAPPAAAPTPAAPPAGRPHRDQAPEAAPRCQPPLPESPLKVQEQLRFIPDLRICGFKQTRRRWAPARVVPRGHHALAFSSEVRGRMAGRAGPLQRAHVRFVEANCGRNQFRHALTIQREAREGNWPLRLHAGPAAGVS